MGFGRQAGSSRPCCYHPESRVVVVCKICTLGPFSENGSKCDRAEVSLVVRLSVHNCYLGSVHWDSTVWMCLWGYNQYHRLVNSCLKRLHSKMVQRNVRSPQKGDTYVQSCVSKRRSISSQIASVSRILASLTTIAVLNLVVTTIPITLLWAVRLNVRLKLEISAVFFLTLFTMITAVVRVVMSLKGKREDDSWLFSWSAVESATGTVPLSVRLLYVRTFLGNS